MATTSHDETPTEVTSGVSRRRMVFRPPTSQSRPATATGIKSTNITVPTTASDVVLPSTSTATSTEELPLKKGKMWSHEEIMIYYEAVKQLGKDFDNITKWVAKRKVHKCKDQIKNFYFNSIKFIRTFADLDVDDQFSGVCRDAKELFLVINACEWRKRTGTSKYQAERLRELILEGSTTIRSKKKALVIKTPPCPALNKYFTQNRRLDREKFPQDIVIKLRPKTYADASCLIAKEKNPFIKIRINSNDRISRFFNYINLKWGSDGQNINPGGSSDIDIVLHPSEEMELGNVVLEMGPPESSTISLNRLRREVEETNSAKQKGASPYSLIVSNPLSIDSKVIMEGLNMSNSLETTAAELYCLCGMSPELNFTYSINVPKRSPDPWVLLSSLLGREYGDAVCVGREDENIRKRTAGELQEEDENASKSRAVVRCSNCKSSSAAGTDDVTPTASRDQYSTPANVPTIVESDIVAEENEAFEKQLQSLTAKRSRKIGTKTSAAPFSQSRITSFVSHVAKDPPPVLPARRNLLQSHNDKNKVTYTSAYKYRIAAEARKHASSICGPTDFSHVADNDNSSCSVLLGLKTPEEKPHIFNPPTSQCLQTYQRPAMTEEERRMKETELFGDMSMSPGHFSNFGDKSRDLNHHHPTEFDLFGGDVSVTPTKTSSQMSMGVSESLQSSALFHVTVNEMMNQNSVDFSRNFLPLLDNIEHPSPKKN